MIMLPEFTLPNEIERQPLTHRINTPDSKATDKVSFRIKKQIFRGVSPEDPAFCSEWSVILSPNLSLYRKEAIKSINPVKVS